MLPLSQKIKIRFALLEYNKLTIQDYSFSIHIFPQFTHLRITILEPYPASVEKSN